MKKDEMKGLIKPVSLGLVCVGGCGTNNAREVMRMLDPQVHPHLSILVCNTDRPQLDNHFVVKDGEMCDDSEKLLQKWIQSNQLTVIQLGESGMGAGGKPEEGAKAAEARIRDIEEFLDNTDAVLLIGGGGKGTGSGALPVIAEAAKKAGKSPLAILTMPRYNEGGRRLRKASEARQKLLGLCPTAVIYNQQLPATDKTYTEVWSAINQSCLLPMLLVLQEIIMEVADLNVDLNDWRAILEAGNYVQFGRCDMSDNVDFSQIAESLLSNPYQDCKIMSQAREILLWLHGPWTVSEHDQLINHLQSSMERDVKDEEIEINPGLYQSARDDKKWAAILVVAKDPPLDTAVVQQQKPAVMSAEQERERHQFYTVARTSEIKCLIGGSMETLTVSEKVAVRWNRMFASSNVKERDVREITEQIKQETGKTPQIPKGLLTSVGEGV